MPHRCPKCDSYVGAHEPVCPNCGAVNDRYRRAPGYGDPSPQPDNRIERTDSSAGLIESARREAAAPSGAEDVAPFNRESHDGDPTDADTAATAPARVDPVRLADPAMSPLPLRTPPPPRPPSLPERKSRWYEEKWARVVGGALLALGIGTWRSGVFDDPPEEQILDSFRSDFLAAGVSTASWDCIESELRENGHIDTLGRLFDTHEFEELDRMFEDVGSFTGLNEAPPELQTFVEGFADAVIDPVDGCLSPQDLAALNTTPIPNIRANAYGSHSQLDSLHDGCAAGVFADCDMLYIASEIGSEYESFAETCGGNEQIDFSRDSCQTTHNDMSGMAEVERQCSGGFFPACDLLYSTSAVGSTEESFGLTCGGRRDPSLVPCFIAYGLGSR